MNVSRRGFLQGAGAVCALGSASAAHAAGGLNERRVPGATLDYKVLEIHFSGGLNHRETLWVERPDEAPLRRVIGDLVPPTDPILAPPGADPAWLAALPAQNAYTGTSYRVGTSPSGSVHLGPCGAPLVAGGLLPRMRLVATGHDSPAHNVGQQYMLHGKLSNAIRGAGLGAPISRHTNRPSFVFFHSGQPLTLDTATFAVQTGFHPSYTAPLLIPYDNPGLVTLLTAPRVPERDALSVLYADRYAKGLTFGAIPERARSVAFDRYLGALDGAFSGPLFAAALSLLDGTENTLWDNGTRRAIRTSAALLSSGLSSYCCVCDGGVVGPAGAPYDTHSVFVDTREEHAAFNTGNVLNVLRTLREEIDAGTLDLSDTIVVLQSEFGRGFYFDDGSEHAHRGFAVGLLGGPIAAGAGGVVGDLAFTSADDLNTYEADNPAIAVGGLDPSFETTPADLRAALLLAAGIHPFQDGVLDIDEDDLNITTTNVDGAADDLAAHIFGV